MFTGIIENTGIVSSIIKKQNTLKAQFRLQNAISDKIKIGDSIAINGVCTTIEEIESKEITVFIGSDTLKDTTLKNLKKGTEINLELPVTPDTFLSGHIVQGHVDTIGRIIKSNRTTGNITIEIEIPSKFSKYIIKKGSITIDGISLTIQQIKGNIISLMLIPETVKRTTLYRNSRPGQEVNIEFDIIGKYTEKLLIT